MNILLVVLFWLFYYNSIKLKAHKNEILNIKIQIYQTTSQTPIYLTYNQTTKTNSIPIIKNNNIKYIQTFIFLISLFSNLLPKYILLIHISYSNIDIDIYL